MKHPVPSILREFWKDTSGQDLVEYALLIGGITLSLGVAVAALEKAIGGLWTTMDTKLQTPGA